MADNTTLDAGSGGDVIATDEISSVKYQRVKLTLGADGVNDGDLAIGNPMPITSDALTELAAAINANRVDVTESNSGAIAASAAVMDDWDEADRAKVNPVVGQAGVTAGAGTSDAATQRVTVATDDQMSAGIGPTTDSAAIAGGSGSVNAKLRLITSQLDALAGYLDGVEAGVAPLALESGGNLAAAASGIGATGDAAATAGGTGSLSAKLRLITSQLNTQAGYLDGIEALLGGLALESGGNLAAIATAMSIIDDWDESDRCKVNPIAGQAGVAAGAGAVSATTQRTTLASDDPAVVALQVIDDWDNAASDGASVSGDTAHDAADAGEPVKVGARATTALSGVTLVADADRTNLHAGIDGVQITRPHCNLEDIVGGNASNTDGNSTQCVAAQASGIKTYLTSIVLTNTSASNIYVEIKDGATTKLTIPVPANGGAIFNPPVPLPGTAATAWNFDPSAATTTVFCSMVGFKSKV